MASNAALVGVSVLLCLSLVAHAVRSRSETERAAPNSSPATTSSTPTTSDSATRADLPGCRADLAACRDESFRIVAKAITTSARERPTTTRSPTESADPIPPTTALEQKRTRCDVAEQQAREHWVRNRASILDSVKTVGTPEWIRAERKKELDGIEKVFGTRQDEKARFDRGYDVLWAKHGAGLRTELDREPPDFGKVIGLVREIFRAEDALVESVLGAHGRDEWRASELRSRTAIMAILAALGDRPFDDDELVW